ncbi:MAG: DUF3301 domain-containing protein [Sulfuriferula sp.]|nr:DUF3301 domain-containing protein [Sulfuriferula sp.]
MEWLVIALALAAAWFWLDSMKCHDIAVATAKRETTQADVQLLDATVALDKLRLARNDHGQLGLRRSYRFEFSETGDNRRTGLIVMQGSAVITVRLAQLWVVN